MTAQIATALSVAIWVYLLLAHGRFWQTSIRLPAGPDPARWPSVTAVVPARNEADLLPVSLPTLLAQRYRGPWRVIVVDDDSDDETAKLAAAAGADVVASPGPPPGWTGKVAAMAAGLGQAGDADFVLFTDADIAYPPDAVTELVRAATGRDLNLVSQMALLRAESFWERLVVPAFVYFFAQLYPFQRVNKRGRTAAAAGGCMLVRRRALERAGGLAEIHRALIDDVALARLLKRRGRIWLGLSGQISSLRPYPRLADLWRMVARSAYTQLRRSPLWLLATIAALLLVYALPVAALIAGLAIGDVTLAVLGGLGWAAMAASYVPMLRFYRLPAVASPVLPLVALLFAAMTLDSARRHAIGRGGAWKGRVAGRHSARAG